MEKQYKAKSTFSFGGRVYNNGDAILETDETALESLQKRGFIAEGKGKEAALEPTMADDLEAGLREKVAPNREKKRTRVAAKTNVTPAKKASVKQTSKKSQSPTKKQAR